MKLNPIPTPESIHSDYQALLDRNVESAKDLRELNQAWNDLDMKLLNFFKRSRIAYNCNTQDEAAKKNYQYFTDELFPVLIRFESEFRKKVVHHPQFEEVAADYPVYYKNMKMGLSLFREENIALRVEDEKLTSEYDALIGGLKVEFRGQAVPYQALGKYLESSDRMEREEAYLIREKAFLSITGKLDELFSKMLKVRHQMAINSGYKNYRDFRFHDLKRFDYNEKDCFEFHDAIEKLIVPILKELNLEKKKALGIDEFRPWDARASRDLKARPPFETPNDLLQSCRAIFKKMDPELHSFFEDMVSKKTLDLEIREGKAGGGFCSDLPLEETSFIFMNATSTRLSVETLIHEAGHAFHNYFSAANVPLYSARHSGSEFAEVASMSMELLTRPYMDHIYSKESLPGILREQLIRAIELFPVIAKIDAFQHWVYTAGENGGFIDDPVAWRKKWLELEERFDSDINWTGHEGHQESGWQWLHVFCVPFYFVDYGIAQLGALTVWANSLKDYDQAIALYKKALKLGGTKPLPELFETIGAKFGLDEKTLRPVLEAVREHIH